MSAVWQEMRKVDKDLVHKDFDDDLLVCNGRGAIPAILRAELIESSALAAPDAELLQAHYLECSHADCIFSAQGRHYHLRNLPVRLPRELAATLTEENEVECLRRNYVETPEAFLLNVEYLHEADEITLLQRFGVQYRHVNDALRRSLSEVIDKLPIQESRPHIYYVTMFNDLKNYFFYRKHHEHVPGIMLMEVARQAMYAQFYKFSSHRRSDVSLTIDSFSVEFMNFVDANYPVRVAVETPAPATVETTEKNGRSVERDFRVATFYQHNKVVAISRLSGTLIKIALFKRLRNVKAVQSHRFTPVKGINPAVVFIDVHGRRQEVTLNDVSMRGLNISMPKGLELDISQAVDFFFFADSIGFIHGKAARCWDAPGNTTTLVGLQITALGRKEEVKLREVIKNFTHIVSRREVL